MLLPKTVGMIAFKEVIMQVALCSLFQTVGEDYFSRVKSCTLLMLSVISYIVLLK